MFTYQRKGKAVNSLYKVEDQWQVGKYMVLFITPTITAVDYNAVEIDGKQYRLVPCSDLKDAVAIESRGQFEGKTVRFMSRHPRVRAQGRIRDPGSSWEASGTVRPSVLPAAGRDRHRARR